MPQTFLRITHHINATQQFLLVFSQIPPACQASNYILSLVLRSFSANSELVLIMGAI